MLGSRCKWWRGDGPGEGGACRSIEQGKNPARPRRASSAAASRWCRGELRARARGRRKSEALCTPPKSAPPSIVRFHTLPPGPQARHGKPKTDEFTKSKVHPAEEVSNADHDSSCRCKITAQQHRLTRWNGNCLTRLPDHQRGMRRRPLAKTVGGIAKGVEDRRRRIVVLGGVRSRCLYLTSEACRSGRDWLATCRPLAAARPASLRWRTSPLTSTRCASCYSATSGDNCSAPPISWAMNSRDPLVHGENLQDKFRLPRPRHAGRSG